MKIEKTYNGPAHSAHGGVAVGRFAGRVARRGPVEVRLLAPPPLETDMSTQPHSDGSVLVTGPRGDIASVRPLDAPVAVGPFSPLPDVEIETAASRYLEDVAENGHPFPRCFGCGPERAPGDGLREFAGPTSAGDQVAARFAYVGNGRLPTWLTWAALDCPSGFAVRLTDNPPPVWLLGTMAGQISGVALAGVEYQVLARHLEVEGRKHTTEVAMLAPDGMTVASARAVWIAADPSRP